MMGWDTDGYIVLPLELFHLCTKSLKLTTL